MLSFCSCLAPLDANTERVECIISEFNNTANDNFAESIELALQSFTFIDEAIIVEPLILECKLLLCSMILELLLLS